MNMFTLFVKPGCMHCARARKALRETKTSFVSVTCKDVNDLARALEKKHLRIPKTLTFPRVYKDSKLVGGADDLVKLLKKI